jgi:hypothetical protein
MIPYFQQSWSLFAPSPGDFSTDVSIRYAVRERDHYRFTPWIDGDSIFPRALAPNPLAPLGLEREIYYSETLITTNGILDVRKFADAHPHSTPGHAVTLAEMPDFVAVGERFFMSLEPGFARDATNNGEFAVQLALREIPNERFGKRFDINPKGSEQRPAATILLPWVRGVAVPSFVAKAQVQ